jgi:hypothetical protein
VKSNWVASFIEGLQSVVNVTGKVKGVISSSISDGVEGGFHRIAPSLVKLCLVSVMLFTGLLMFGLGLSTAFENVLHVPGLGYMLTGIAFFAAGALYYAFSR